MSEIVFENKAYAKIILHAAKYPHCAVNGVLLAESTKIDDPSRVKELNIVDSIPLFHQCLHVTPMAEVALTQIDAVAQNSGLIIAGYYAACENFQDNAIEKCPGMKIAEKISENFPSAIVVIVDNKRLVKHLDTPAIKISQFADGKWKKRDANSFMFTNSYILESVSNLLHHGVHKELVDFDNHLDDLTLDWSNKGIHTLLDSLENADE